MEDYLSRLREAINAFYPLKKVKTVDKRLIILINLIIECLMRGRRETVGERIFIRKRFSFWSFLTEFSAPNTIEEVLLLPAVNSFYESQARKVEAWIISSLNQGDLSIYFYMFQGDKKFIQTYYSKSKGSLFTKEGFLDKIIPMIVEMEESLEFSIKFDDYSHYFYPKNLPKTGPSTLDNDEKDPKSSVSASISAAIESYGEGHLVSPVPMIESNPKNLVISTTPSICIPQSDTNENQSLRSSTKEASDASMHMHTVSDGDTFDMEPLNKVYISEFRKFIDRKEPNDISEDMESFAYSDSNPLSILMPLGNSSDANTSSTTSIIMENIIPADVEIIPIGQSAEEKDGIKMEELESIQAELSNIMERPRSAMITLIEGGDNKAFVPYPPLVPTPSTDPGHVIDLKGSPFVSEESHASGFSELGFFGIPLSIKSLALNFRPFGRMIQELSRVNLFEDDAANSADTSMQDQFDFITALRAFEPVSNVCQQCNEFLTGEKDRRVCDISGKVFCANCFEDVRLESPARILNDWDFGAQSIHRETYLHYYPQFSEKLINIDVSFPGLYEKVADLRLIREKRMLILNALNHVAECPTNIYSQVQSKFRFLPHLINSAETYTIQDLIDVKKGVVMPLLEAIFHKLDYHITVVCVRCRKHGQLCHICRDELFPIYPHRRDLYQECQVCGFMAHPHCWPSDVDCPQCNRIHVSLDSPSVDPVITPNS